MIRILKTERRKKERTEKLSLAGVLIGKDFQLHAGVAQLVEHRPSKPKKANRKTKSRRSKPTSDKPHK